MDDYAADVEAVLDALEIETAAIGGLSMGGYITFALHRRAPDRFTSILLADTKAEADTPEGRENRRAMSALVNAEGVGAVADQMLPKLLSASAGSRSRRHDAPTDRAEHRRGHRPRDPRDDGAPRFDTRPVAHGGCRCW